MSQVMQEKVGAWLIEPGHTKQGLASMLGMTTQTLNNRLRGTYEWTWSEILTISKILGCTTEELT